MSINSTSPTYFYTPALQIDVPNDETCRRAMCPNADSGTTRCQYPPRYAEEVVIAFTVKNGKCKEGQYNISAPPEAVSASYGYEPDKYPTMCTFSNQACAELVCNQVQTSSKIKATDDGKSWTCLSDSAVAKAAGDGTYWFANGTNPCKDAPPTCTELEGRSYNDVHPVSGKFVSGARSSIPRSMPVVAVCVAAALLGLVA